MRHSRKEYGSNQIPDSEPTTFWEEFKETFGDPMIKILLVLSTNISPVISSANAVFSSTADFLHSSASPFSAELSTLSSVMIVMFFFGYAEIYEPMGTIAAVIIVAVVSAKTGVASVGGKYLIRYL